MKKTLVVFLLVFKVTYGNCDVIFFPVQYSVFCYSVELTSMRENIKTSKNTSGFWTGVGCVGSFFYLDHPVGGLEMAFEGRHYFKPDLYKRFFFSWYAGGALMTDFENTIDVGLVPGIKINYKSQISKRMVLEPYIGLSLPLTYNIENSHPYVPLPTLTIGVRFGFSELVHKLKS